MINLPEYHGHLNRSKSHLLKIRIPQSSLPVNMRMDELLLCYCLLSVWAHTLFHCSNDLSRFLNGKTVYNIREYNSMSVICVD